MYYAHTLRKFNGFTHVGVIAISSYSCTDVLLFIMVGIIHIIHISIHIINNI